MKNFDIKSIILGIVMAFAFGVSAAIIYDAKDISFTPSDTSWNVDNIDDALNDIKDNYYSKSELNKMFEESEYSIEYDFTGYYKTFVAPYTGVYKVELWGAQGASSSGVYGGKGAYVSGNINLNKNDKIYVYVGGQGSYGTSISNANGGGWNGGGNNYLSYSSYSNGGTGGGGATDIRIVKTSNNNEWNESESLKSRILVAAGGGGSGYSDGKTATDGGAGGTSVGKDGGMDTRLTSNTSLIYKSGLSTGGTQTSGGVKSGCGSGWCKEAQNGSFGIGGDAAIPYNDSSTSLGYPGGGGGGGYYGGAGGGSGYTFSGAGGSSYAKGVSGYDTTYLSNQGNINVSGAIIKSGLESIPTHDGSSTMTGNTGNGYAKITLISVD